MAIDNTTIIQQTKDWIGEVVIGLQLCPFAAPVFDNDSIEYIVCDGDEGENLLQLGSCFSSLDIDTGIETSLLIFPTTYLAFDDYLELLHLGNLLLDDLGYSGIYQLASFHPDYRFADSDVEDAANFSNRSPYPMLHVLRERSVERAVSAHDNIEAVPTENIRRLRQLGPERLRQKLENIQQNQ